MLQNYFIRLRNINEYRKEFFENKIAFLTIYMSVIRKKTTAFANL